MGPCGHIISQGVHLALRRRLGITQNCAVRFPLWPYSLDGQANTVARLLAITQRLTSAYHSATFFYACAGPCAHTHPVQDNQTANSPYIRNPRLRASPDASTHSIAAEERAFTGYKKPQGGENSFKLATPRSSFLKPVKTFRTSQHLRNRKSKQLWQPTPFPTTILPPSAPSTTKSKQPLPTPLGTFQLTVPSPHLSHSPLFPPTSIARNRPLPISKDMSLILRLMSPTSPKSSTTSSSDASSPPLTMSSTDSSSNMSWGSSPAETRNHTRHPAILRESTFFKNSEEKPPQNSQAQECASRGKEPTAMTYVVSLLHALPFLFQARPLPAIGRGEDLQTTDLHEPSKIWRELLVKSPSGRILIPFPSNPMYMNMHCSTVCAALHALPIDSLHTSMASTLISATYPLHYRWNLPVTSPISRTTPIPLIPASRYTSRIETYYYSQFNDGVIVHKDHTDHTYNDKSYLPTRYQGNEPTDYPFGWTTGIEAYCHDNGYHPECTDPIRCTFIEREFIAHTINDPGSLETLNDYLCVIYSNTVRHNLQWLFSSPTLVEDNVREHLTLTKLYSQVDHQNSRVFHTQKGLRIIIPEERWNNWQTFSPSSQKEFTRVAWAQLTQFDKHALMASLQDGKLDDITLYFDFDDDAKHNRFWDTELETVHRYYVELITRTGAFHCYNQYIMQELAYNNEPLHLPLMYNWDTEGHPLHIFLPYSRLMLRWDPKLNKWDYKNPDVFGHKPCSVCSIDMHEKISCKSPSLAEPINEFKLEDGEIR